MNYHNITYPDMNNGEGLRVVLWLSGCSHKCKGCQNPQTWDANSGIPFDEAAKEELFRELDKDYISGLTLSGGDPLFEGNLDGVLGLVNEVNERYNSPKDGNEFRLSSPRKSIWLYTGYEWDHIFNSHLYYNLQAQKKLSREKWKRQYIVSMCDVLIDGRYINTQRDVTLKWRGSRNQRIINVQKTLQKKKVVLWCD